LYNNPSVPPAYRDMMNQQLANQSPDALKAQSVATNGAVGAAHLLVGLLGMIGGMRMLSLRSYGLAVMASLLTAVPCLSPLACCLLGEIVGLWAIVVLISPVVRAAF